MAYVSDGSLTTDKREVAIDTTWDTQTDWEAYQSINNVAINSGAVELAESAYPASLTARWPFEDEADTSTAIDTEGDNDLTLSGPTYDDTTVKEGSHSLMFDGTDDHAEHTGPITDPSLPWTFCTWVYRRTSDRGTLYSNRTPSNNAGEFQLVTEATSGDVTMFVLGSNHATSGLSVPSSTWTFVGCAYDGSGSVTFQVGTQTATDACGTVGSFSNDVALGATLSASGALGGNLDVPTYYDTNLTASEMEDVRQADL